MEVVCGTLNDSFAPIAVLSPTRAVSHLSDDEWTVSTPA